MALIGQGFQGSPANCGGCAQASTFDAGSRLETCLAGQGGRNFPGGGSRRD